MPPGTLRETLEMWVVTHILAKYPDLSVANRKALYRQSAALKRGYAALSAAEKEGDAAAATTAAREIYLEWVAALKATRMPDTASEDGQGSQGSPGKSSDPGASESPFRGYHSDPLDADLFLAESAGDMSTLRTTYIPRELSVLRELKAKHPQHFPGILARIHDAKTLFGGTIERMAPLHNS